MDNFLNIGCSLCAIIIFVASMFELYKAVVSLKREPQVNTNKKIFEVIMYLLVSVFAFMISVRILVF